MREIRSGRVTEHHKRVMDKSTCPEVSVIPEAEVVVTILETGQIAFWGDVVAGRQISTALGSFVFQPTPYCG